MPSAIARKWTQEVLDAEGFQPEQYVACVLDARGGDLGVSTVSSDALMSGAKRRLLIGPVGSGKTSTLLWTAHDLLAKQFTNALERVPVPVYARLGCWLAEHTTALAFLIGNTGPLGTYVPWLIEQGRAILLLDGITEIQPDLLPKALDELNALLDMHSNLTIVVSSRRPVEANVLTYFQELRLLPPSATERAAIWRRLYAEAVAPVQGPSRTSTNVALTGRWSTCWQAKARAAAEADTCAHERFLDRYAHRALRGRITAFDALAKAILQHVDASAPPVSKTAAISLAGSEALSEGLDAGILTETSVGISFDHPDWERYSRARQVWTSVNARKSGAAAEHLAITNDALLLPCILSADNTRTLAVEISAEQPGLASDIVRRRRGVFSDSQLRTLASTWMSELATTSATDPHRRLDLGRALGQHRLSTGEHLDTRPGVGVMGALPEIRWMRLDLPDSGGDHVLVSQHPITVSQFQCFLEADKGWAEPGWWSGGVVPEHDIPDSLWNHPRTHVSAPMAQAFCKWLSNRRGQRIDLPTRSLWLLAAQAPSVPPPYPGYAHASSRPAELTPISCYAVGLFPEFTWRTDLTTGPMDMGGNIWEWCLADSDDVTQAATTPFWLCGGSWKVASKNVANFGPPKRHSGLISDSDIGFRVVNWGPLTA